MMDSLLHPHCARRYGAEHDAGRHERLRLGEQHEDLLGIATSSYMSGLGGGSSGDTAHGPHHHGPDAHLHTVVRRFPNAIVDKEPAEFIGGSETTWAPEALRATLLDQREGYLAALSPPEGRSSLDQQGRRSGGELATWRRSKGWIRSMSMDEKM